MESGAFDDGYVFFERLIVPHLLRCNAIPSEFIGDRTEFMRELFLLSVRTDLTQLERQSRMFDQFGLENLDFMSLTIIAHNAVQIMMTLMAAKVDGIEKARGVTAHNGCATCVTEISGKVFAIDDLLSAYESVGSGVPIIPHARCEHTMEDGGGWCRCSWQTLPKPVPGADPKFLAWMKETLAPVR